MLLKTETVEPKSDRSFQLNDLYRLRRDIILLSNTVTSQYVALINTAILAFMLIGEIARPVLYAWTVVMVSLALLRVFVCKARQAQNVALTNTGQIFLDTLAFLSGCLWGVVPFLLSETASGTSMYLVVFMIAGMTAGAALAFASHIRTVVAFNFPALCMLAGYHLFGATGTDYAMCLVLVLYFSATLSLSNRANKILLKSIANEIKARTRQTDLEQKETALQTEMHRRAEKEEELQATLGKNRRINSELETIFKEVLQSRDRSREEVLPDLISRVTNVLGVERASIWLFTPEHDAIDCINVYDTRSGHSTEPMRLQVGDNPAYFEAIKTSRYIDASVAREDKRTSLFNEGYFVPLDIYSLLDAPILASAERRGVLCCESVGRVHVWTPDEISFVSSIAQMIGMLLLTEEAEVLAKELQVALQEARRASATKSAFLANMSHEIRTPMNGVLGAATALKDTGLDEAQLKFADVIHDSGDALMAVLNDILDFSKIEAGRIKIEQAAFSLRSVIEKVAAIHELKARERGLGFSVQVDTDISDIRRGDAHRLGQILHNLLSNAIKFTHEGGIEVSVRSGTTSFVELQVRDTGVGMTEEEAQRAFEQFAQADESTTRQYGGTGLGLSIVKGLIEAMGGTVRCKTEKGAGTTFLVSLPLPDAEAAELQNETGAETVNVAELPVKVLLAEDNATNRMVIEAFLKPFDLEITSVENGLEAVEAFSVYRFDVVLMDIQMPLMDGTQALSEIRRLEKEQGIGRVPVIATTANAMTHQIEHYRSLGFDSHLSKPIRRDELLETLCQTYRARTYQTEGVADSLSQPA